MRSRSYNRFKQFESRSNRAGQTQLETSHDDVLVLTGGAAHSNQKTLGDRDALAVKVSRGGVLRVNEFNLIDVQKDVAIAGRNSPAKAEPRSVFNFAADVKAS